ncbi:hypothetical protein Dimus_014015 [Dionaea muscipula]
MTIFPYFSIMYHVLEKEKRPRSIGSSWVQAHFQPRSTLVFGFMLQRITIENGKLGTGELHAFSARGSETGTERHGAQRDTDRESGGDQRRWKFHTASSFRRRKPLQYHVELFLMML